MRLLNVTTVVLLIFLPLFLLSLVDVLLKVGCCFLAHLADVDDNVESISLTQLVVDDVDSIS